MSDVQSMPKLPVTLPTSTGPALTLVPFATVTVPSSKSSTSISMSSANSENIPTINIQPMISKPTSVSPVSNLLNNNSTINTSAGIPSNNVGGFTGGGNPVALITNNNQTDYFRNCNVPNLINKWRRRHTWIFLKEGKMFCQVWTFYFLTFFRALFLC